MFVCSSEHDQVSAYERCLPMGGVLKRRFDCKAKMYVWCDKKAKNILSCRKEKYC